LKKKKKKRRRRRRRNKNEQFRTKQNAQNELYLPFLAEIEGSI